MAHPKISKSREPLLGGSAIWNLVRVTAVDGCPRVELWPQKEEAASARPKWSGC